MPLTCPYDFGFYPKFHTIFPLLFFYHLPNCCSLDLSESIKWLHSHEEDWYLKSTNSSGFGIAFPPVLILHSPRYFWKVKIYFFLNLFLSLSHFYIMFFIPYAVVLLVTVLSNNYSLYFIWFFLVFKPLLNPWVYTEWVHIFSWLRNWFIVYQDFWSIETHIQLFYKNLLLNW